MNSIEQTAALAKRCGLLMSNDTGIMRLGVGIDTSNSRISGSRLGSPRDLCDQAVLQPMSLCRSVAARMLKPAKVLHARH